MTTDLDTVVSKKKKLDEEERIFVATQWQLMWWKFRKHKMAVVSALISSSGSHGVSPRCNPHFPYRS